MSKRVLVAPLNWGLGHATRCIPIIRELLQQGAEVILASDGQAYELLKKEFPQLTTEKLPAYNVHYQTDNIFWNMATQSLKILRAIYLENRHLQKLIQLHRIDCVISDNRFGCFSRNVPCIFITHQINLRASIFFFQRIIRWLNRLFIRQFDECWVPDEPGQASIAGELIPTTGLFYQKHIGILSRMQPMKMQQRFDVVVVLSGPEPQRTRLEQIILQQIIHLDFHFLLVQGKPEQAEPRSQEADGCGGNKISIIPFLSTHALNETIAASSIIVCRSGYSSIMDLAILGKRAIFIPTPGQTEQEYLAERLLEKGLFYYQKQSELNLAKALEEAEKFPGFNPAVYQNSQTRLAKAVQELLYPNKNK